LYTVSKKKLLYSCKAANCTSTVFAIAKELMAQWQRPLAGRLLPRVQTLGAAPKTSGVSLGVFLSKKNCICNQLA
jgi:hypothetical protein